MWFAVTVQRAGNWGHGVREGENHWGSVDQNCLVLLDCWLFHVAVHVTKMTASRMEKVTRVGCWDPGVQEEEELTAL